MPTPFAYEQIASTAIYEIPRGDNAAGWAGYVLPGTTLPATIGLVESFDTLGGSYLFAVTRPTELDSDPGGFAARALEYFRTNAFQQRGVAWLASASPAVFGPFAELGFAFSKDLYGIQLRSNLNVRLGGTLNFFVLKGLYIRIDEATASLVVSIKRGSVEFIGFQRGPYAVGITVSPGERQEARIAVAGPNTASFVFTADLAPATAFGATGIPVGCAYFVRTQTAQATRAPGTRLAAVADTRLDYPMLDVAALPNKLASIGVVDPSDPFNRALGESALQAGALRTGFGLSGTAALASQLRTVPGHPLQLLPFGVDPAVIALPPAAGALALASASPVDAARKDSLPYLSLAGELGLVAGDTATTEDLLCGMFGSERLRFLSSVVGGARGDVMRWVPSQPAYAPVFPFDRADLNQPDSGCVRPRLDPRYRTSWVTLAGAAQPVRYSAEPEGAPLYGDADSAGLLSATPQALPISGDPAYSFPLVAYAGVQAPADVIHDLVTGVESEILAPTRRTIISQGAAPTWQRRAQARRALAAQTTTSTTPQGLIVTIDTATGAYQRVLLAQSTDDAGALIPLAFDQPTIAMQQALQTNQLFVVAVNPGPFDDPATGATFANVVDLAGWTMTANVGRGATPTAYKNVLIMKFCTGSLAERVTNPNRWTDPEVFSLLPSADTSGGRTRGSVRAGGSCNGDDALAYTGLSQWLQDYIAAAIAQADGGGSAAPFYRRFKQVVTDPAWNGVIVLAADLASGGLPPQIQGLAAGIDVTRFASHHFGFTASRVVVSPGTGQIGLDGPSSFFGLVDYLDLAYAQNVLSGGDPDLPIAYEVAGDFGFTVLELRSLFENTAVTRFESRIQLTARRLFGSSILETYRHGIAMPETGVVLAGSYVDQGGAGAYVFEQTVPSVFITDSNALGAVAFNRVQFNTLGTRDDGATIASRFLIWGAFELAELHASDHSVLDVLSFGSPADTPPKALGVGLAFSNLVLDMTFPVTTPTATVLVMGTANLAYDLGASRARGDSLFNGFALELKSFVEVSDAHTPAELGFLSVSSSLVLERLTVPWYGVVYEVTLGGPGALASAAGFTSKLLVAWSPKATLGAATHSVFLGLSLPGAAPAAKLFSVEGVFKVAVGSIALSRQVVPDTGQDPPPPPRHYYCLRLDDIALKIFGIVKLPPSATIRFFLFGDPDQLGSLAWYAAYVADQVPALAVPAAAALEEAQP